jgi:hypothetical protein
MGCAGGGEFPSQAEGAVCRGGPRLLHGMKAGVSLSHEDVDRKKSRARICGVSAML